MLGQNKLSNIEVIKMCATLVELLTFFGGQKELLTTVIEINATLIRG